jgi:NMD protein affecting ribosome stability and mRNA decay
MKAQRRPRTHRQEQLLAGFAIDPYRPQRKVRGATRCSECAAVFHRGRWSWRATPSHAAAGLCPACRRIRERLPAGFVRLSGPFLQAHREELLHRVRRCEESERREHPVQRIMSIQATDGDVLVTTTDAHLARRIGDALRDAYKGELSYRYSKGEPMLRVSWSR